MENTTTIEDLSQAEIEFKKKFPEAYERYRLYLNYYIVKTGKNLKGKDYETVLIKGFIAYFLHREGCITGKKTIPLMYISKLLNYVAHTGAIYAINRIKTLLKTQPKYKLVNMKRQYIKDYFTAFNNILLHSIKKNNK